MEDSYNVDPNNAEAPKTSSTDGTNSSKTTGDSQVQNGAGVIKNETEIPADKADDPIEYIEQANNNTEVANQSPVQNGKGMTMSATFSNEDDDDDDDDDDGEDPLTEVEIGDDPDETKKKIPVF
jgi:FAD/FMN-containing dehydrogenase